MIEETGADRVILRGEAEFLSRQLPIILGIPEDEVAELLSYHFAKSCELDYSQAGQMGADGVFVEFPKFSAPTGFSGGCGLMVNIYVIRNSDIKLFDALLAASGAMIAAAVSVGKIPESAWGTLLTSLFSVLRNVRSYGVKLSPEQAIVYSTLSIVRGSAVPGLRVEDIEAYLAKSKKLLSKETIQECLDLMTKCPAHFGPIELVYKNADNRWMIHN